MRITHVPGEHLIALTDAEASRLVDACALIALATGSVPDAVLPPELATVLGDLFEGLRGAARPSTL
ncbi:MAG: hypothetical protein WD136_02630 [Cyanobium sp.]